MELNHPLKTEGFSSGESSNFHPPIEGFFLLREPVDGWGLHVRCDGSRSWFFVQHLSVRFEKRVL